MGVSNRLFFFLTFVVYIVVISNINNGVEASHRIYAKFQTFPAEKVDPTNKPVYHFQPPKHWMNDPNGPMYFNGIYHLFYQYNPYGSVWGNIIWAHSVSRDLVNWEAVEPAIKPSKSFDFNGTWSGSATILPGNKPIILYTGVVENQQQLQAYALPANTSDPYLRKWIVPDRYNPIIHPTGVNGSAFRDPTTAWKGTDGLWRILIGGRRKHRGMAHLYKSRDFFRWRKAKKPLHSKAMTGMWECPDFFPVSLTGKTGLDTLYIEKGVKYVLKNSLDVTRYDYYTLGTYLVDKDRYIPDNTSEDGWRGLRYDYGNFYASKSFFDPKKNRRILWGWSNESDSKQDDINKGWAGLQTIPRSVWLDTNGRQLVQWPVEEIETLRGKKVTLNNQELKLGQNVEVQGITAAQADVDVTFSFPSLDKAEPFDPKLSHLDAEHLCGQKGSRVQGGLGPFGLLTLASQKLEEFTPVFFRIFKKPDKHVVLMCSDASTSSLKTNSEMFKPSFAGFMDVDLSDKKLSLRSLIDHSVVESFGAGGRTCITSRVYPTLAITNNAHLFLFNNGTETIKVEKLDVWNMNKPKMNGA